MRLALVRHAQRNFGLGSEDAGISLQGKAQSQALARYFRDNWAAGVTEIFSSPKLRCLETAAPIVEQLGLTLQIVPGLDECLGHEAASAFEERVAETLSEIRRGAKGTQVIVVSHSDWLEWASLILAPPPDALERARLKLDNAAAHLLTLDGEQATYLKKNFRP
jgi:broad specificity phosphatase PhoE